MARIGVKFCGHCQPQREMGELLAMLRTAPDMEFVLWSAPDYEVLLVLHACTSACAAIPDFPGPVVEVIGSTLDFVTYDEDQALADAVLERLRKATGTRNEHDTAPSNPHATMKES